MLPGALSDMPEILQDSMSSRSMSSGRQDLTGIVCILLRPPKQSESHSFDCSDCPPTPLSSSSLAIKSSILTFFLGLRTSPEVFCLSKSYFRPSSLFKLISSWDGTLPLATPCLVTPSGFSVEVGIFSTSRSTLTYFSFLGSGYLFSLTWVVSLFYCWNLGNVLSCSLENT